MSMRLFTLGLTIFIVLIFTRLIILIPQLHFFGHKISPIRPNVFIVADDLHNIQ